MKAVICNEKGKALEITDMPIPVPQDDEVLIKLKASGINHRDLLIQKGKYVNLKYPIILGSDGAGIIERLGKNVEGLTIGQEVIINPALNWGNNPRFPGKDFKILGLPDNGTYAEYVAVSANAIFAKPSHLSFEQAAAIPLSGLTGYRALVTRGEAKAGQKVLITGIGGAVAQMVLQFALALGAEVYFTSGDEEKKEKAISLGAKNGVNYKRENWADELREIAGGFNVIIDTAAGPGFEKLLDLANLGAKIVTFGATAGPISQIPPQKIYLKQLDILGTMMGSREDFTDMIKLVEDKKIIPIIDEVFSINSANEALLKMEKGAQFGKIILAIQH